MPVPVADCPVMLIGCDLKKDGHKLTLIVPQDAIPRLLLDAKMGTKFMAAFALYTEHEASPSPDSPVSEGIAPVADQPNGDEGSRRPATGADRAIKMAHVYAGGDSDILNEIRKYCEVHSCAEFKTNPKALARFHDWEFINGYVQVRP